MAGRPSFKIHLACGDKNTRAIVYYEKLRQTLKKYAMKIDGGIQNFTYLYISWLQLPSTKVFV